MKVKLLKKIRKRFEVYNYPKGINKGENITVSLMVLYDGKERISVMAIKNGYTTDFILDHFRNIILRKVRKEYSAYSGKLKKRIKIKW